MPRLTSMLRLLVLACLVWPGLAACGGGGGSGGGDGNTTTGTLKVAITDAAATDFATIVIAIREIRAVPAGAEGNAEAGLPLVVAFNPPKVIDVLDLAYQQQLLGQATLASGDYTQLRLVLAENVDGQPPVNYLTLADDPATLIPLKTPSGQESGLKVLGDFVVAAGQINTIVLDFDPEKAIVEAGNSGNWIFKPTGIRIVQVDDLLAVYGAIAGKVLGGTGGTTPLTTARVYALSPPTGSGTEVAGGSVSPDDASFRLLLPSGTYELRVTADNHANYTSLPTIYTVLVGKDIDAGNIVMIPLGPP